MELVLPPDVQHPAAESEYNFERALPMATSLVAVAPLVWVDSCFCSANLMQEFTAQAFELKREIAFIIKLDPRRAPVEMIAAGKVADSTTQWVMERLGKRQCIWQESLQLAGVGSDTNPSRRVYLLIEQTIDQRGNALLLPEYVLEGCTTTLPPRLSPAEIIAFFWDHATH